MGAWLLLLGTAFFFIGEIWTSKTVDMLEEAQSVVVRVDDLSQIDPSLDGHLIYAVDTATTDETLSDSAFGFSAQALYLKRNVRYYQIVESSHEKIVGTDDDGKDVTETVYEYDYKWVDEPVKSNHFYERKYRGKNFTRLLIDTVSQWATECTLGAYRLTEPLLSQMIVRTVLPVGDLDAATLLAWNQPDVTTTEDAIYFCIDPEHPQVGDVQVTFEALPPQTVSVLAGVSGDSLTYYRAEKKARMACLMQEKHPLYFMMEAQGIEKKETSGMSRFFGFLHVLFGIWLIIIGLNKRESDKRWIRVVTSGPQFLAALCLTVGWSLTIGSLPWLDISPLYGFVFLALGLLILWLTWTIKSRRTY